jgi:hypothetical protein
MLSSEAFYWHFTGDNEKKKTEILGQGNLSPGLKLNQKPPEYGIESPNLRST